MEDKIEETQEKKPNKFVTWFKDHKKTLRDVGIGAAAVSAIVVLSHLGKSEEIEEPAEIEAADSEDQSDNQESED